MVCARLDHEVPGSNLLEEEFRSKLDGSSLDRAFQYQPFAVSMNALNYIERDVNT